MLPHFLTRSLRTTTTTAARLPIWTWPLPLTGQAASCTSCRCHCGNVFGLELHVDSQQKRGLAGKARKAPATRDRERERELFSLIGTRRKAALPASVYIQDKLAHAQRRSAFDTPLDNAMAFLERFRDLTVRAKGSVTADPKQTRECLDEYGISDRDAVYLPQVLLREGSTNSMTLAKKLMLTLSRLGCLDASITIMSEAVLSAKKDPRVLRAREVMFAKEHLSSVANAKTDYRAMVCEGKVAHALGDEDRAIEMWTNAMNAAVLANQRETSERMQRDKLELSSPWIELMLIHWERSKLKGKDEMAKCEWAMKIGCEQDDPTSHYHASTFVKRFDRNGNHVGSSDWFYHVTKAAASGHPKAAYELGVFYAESGWKYIEDEPPDHVKPTPFDSYPGIQTTLWDSVLTFLRIKQKPTLEPRESVFHTAAFPSTAAERYKMASGWLNVAIGYNYAPAYLFLARMCLEPKLWAGANTPSSALQLSSARYTYASKEDYIARRHIPNAAEESEADVTDPENPFRDEETAKDLLREVFYAHDANEYGLQARGLYARSQRKRQFGDEEKLFNQKLWAGYGANVRKFFRFGTVREMYEDQIEVLYKEAMDLCDQHKFDIYDDAHALVYKAGSGKKRKILDVYIVGLS